MLLLVAAAGFVFLLQGGLRLRNEARDIAAANETLRAEVAAAELELASEVATREAVVAALATAESDNLIIKEELVASQQALDSATAQVDELTGEADGLRDTLAQLQDEAQARRPVARIVTPLDGATLPVGRPASIVLVAGDAVGLTSLTLEVDGQSFGDYPLDGGTGFGWWQQGDLPPESTNVGMITIDAWEGDMVTGSYTLTFAGAVLEGEFAGPRCPPDGLCG